jgi:hypothetical protein
MRYPFWKAFIPALFGKILMTFIIAFSGQQSIEIILNIFGGSGLLGMLITSALLFIIILAMIRIDWEKLFEKHIKSN